MQKIRGVRYYTIIILLIVFSCGKKEIKEGIIIDETGIENYKVNIKAIEENSKDSIKVNFRFLKENSEHAIFTITNNRKRNIVLNNWFVSNPCCVLEFRDDKGKVIGTLPASVPPKNIEKYDTILKPNQNIEYVIPTFSASCCEGNKGEVFVKIWYNLENEKQYIEVESNHFFYEKEEIKT